MISPLHRRLGGHLPMPVFNSSTMLMLRLKISAKVCPHLHSITTVSFSTSASASPSISTVDLLDSYTVTPPIQPWPRRLHPKRLISLITREPNLDLALQIFHHASKFHPGFSHNYHTYHAILNRLSRSRAFHPKIDPLLSDLSNSGIKCSEDLFITLIRNFGVLGRPKLSFKTFLDIPKLGAQRSAKSLNALLNALVQNHEYGLVHSVFKNCGQRFGVRPNVFTCNILIKALCQKGDVETALKVLDEMPAMGFVPDVVTYTTVLGGYVLRGDMVGAKRVFGEVLDRGWHPDATTYTILMDGFVKQGKLVDAVRVMDEMEENKVGPNEVTYGVMIEAYCKAKKSGEAVNLLNDMLEKRYIPSSALCCKVIDILCHEGKAEDGCELWKRLLKNNCTPDNAISSTVIYWLCKEGKVWEAKKLFNQFKTDLIPSVMTYNMLIAGLCEVGELCEAGRLWDDMVEKGCAPNAFTYNMLIKGFCKIGKAEEGIRILEEMLDKGCLPNKSTYGMLIEGLCDLGKESEVTKVISLAMSNGDIESASWDLLLTKFVGDLDTGGAVMDKILVENVN
ncbi:PREDICTED: pentatricopeptide repeat-containing protein At5g16420, mitochondrial [Prunus mume]|uniref:Pentatricopeptide repeat-containing protein At5g16420, mitochondrial n=1 Tax=Prunus mume TaxID=102107 RepID=A0ABM0NZJ5_PRUMU|nr:PREDICTED: pentatricopeptide repeat-containing protein At5g16420, mitochondrial [Prunus mume]XP_008232206.1 PREDICTED: pentatricopeptide repeat-containing protein At5g16420, mitochondrial [Prunus mume]